MLTALDAQMPPWLAYELANCDLNKWWGRVHYARLAAGKRKSEAADAIGIARPTYQVWEEGRVRKFNSEFAEGLAAAFECSLTWLVNGKGEAPVIKPSAITMPPERPVIDQGTARDQQKATVAKLTELFAFAQQERHEEIIALVRIACAATPEAFRLLMDSARLFIATPDVTELRGKLFAAHEEATKSK